MADKIDTNKAIAYLEYDIAKNKVEPEDAEKIKENIMNLSNVYVK